MEWKHFCLLKALALWCTRDTIIPGSLPPVSINRGAQTYSGKRGIPLLKFCRWETEARSGSVRTKPKTVTKAKVCQQRFSLGWVALTSEIVRTGSKTVIIAPRTCCRDPSPAKYFPSCWCWSWGLLAGDQQIHVAIQQSVLGWTLEDFLGILHCLWQPFPSPLPTLGLFPHLCMGKSRRFPHF